MFLVVEKVHVDSTMGSSLDDKLRSIFFSQIICFSSSSKAVGVHLDDNPLVSLTQMPMGGIWQAVSDAVRVEARNHSFLRLKAQWKVSHTGLMNLDGP